MRSVRFAPGKTTFLNFAFLWKVAELMIPLSLLAAQRTLPSFGESSESFANKVRRALPTTKRGHPYGERSRHPTCETLRKSIRLRSIPWTDKVDYRSTNFWLCVEIRGRIGPRAGARVVRSGGVMSVAVASCFRRRHHHLRSCRKTLRTRGRCDPAPRRAGRLSHGPPR